MNSVLVLGTELFDDSAPIAIAVGCRHIAMNSFFDFYREFPGLMYLLIDGTLKHYSGCPKPED